MYNSGRKSLLNCWPILRPTGLVATSKLSSFSQTWRIHINSITHFPASRTYYSAHVLSASTSHLSTCHNKPRSWPRVTLASSLSVPNVLHYRQFTSPYSSSPLESPAISSKSPPTCTNVLPNSTAKPVPSLSESFNSTTQSTNRLVRELNTYSKLVRFSAPIGTLLLFFPSCWAICLAAPLSSGGEKCVALANLLQLFILITFFLSNVKSFLIGTCWDCLPWEVI